MTGNPTQGEESSLESEIRTFQTACDANTPYAFAIISDTQDNPKVAGKIAEMAWQQRPSFAIHPGDLVGVGTKRSDWTEEFFPSMLPLMSRVPLYPVLGNHEEDTHYYYEYMHLPAPEYYYSFKYGNAEFFMIDTNRKVNVGSEQYRWLDRAMSQSQAVWKFAVHHHPPYSSDETTMGIYGSRIALLLAIHVCEISANCTTNIRSISYGMAIFIRTSARGPCVAIKPFRCRERFT